ELLQTVTGLTSKANPTASLWAARGALERTLGLYKDAAASLAKAAAADPRNEFALYELAANALDAKDPDTAESHIARFGELAPDSSDHKYLRARLLTARNDLHGALTTLNSIKSPTSAAVELRGRLEVELATDPADLEAKLAADPGNIELMGRLCVLYRRQNPAKALDNCKSAYNASGDISHAIGFGAALVQARQFQNAVTLLRQISTTAPDNSTVRANLVTALFQLKQYQEAKKELRWLLDRDPDLVNAYYFLAVAHDNLGEYLDAMANYQEFKRRADPQKNADEIGRVDLRLPTLQRQINTGKGRK
ncbi:MAG TPA: tetratricopeptide repeat protein, partial [Pyrinomonadaceae bacterium]|nr:tetratricopeptide repeat protein [Pyrinomonadaceae bacterium]